MNIADIKKRLDRLQANRNLISSIDWLNSGEEPNDPDKLYIRWLEPGEQATIMPLSLGRHAKL